MMQRTRTDNILLHTPFVLQMYSYIQCLQLSCMAFGLFLAWHTDLRPMSYTMMDVKIPARLLLRPMKLCRQMSFAP